MSFWLLRRYNETGMKRVQVLVGRDPDHRQLVGELILRPAEEVELSGALMIGAEKIEGLYFETEPGDSFPRPPAKGQVLRDDRGGP